MSYRLIDSDPPPDTVLRLTVVPFLPDGTCALVPAGPAGLGLPSGDVRDGEHYLLDTALRVPLETAGFRPQRVHPFAADAGHLYVWVTGDRYRGRRPHRAVDLVTGGAEDLAARLRAGGRPDTARVLRDAAASFHGQDESSYYADELRLLEPAYLRATTDQAGSGFGGTAAEWRAAREMIVEGVDRDGTFLDLGCANGLLMESVRAWAAERGHRIEPYGVDLSARLVDLARRRLPAWADRIEAGNAIDHRPADGRRFTFVHALLDLVPDARRAALVRHALDALVEPGGRLLVSHYGPAGGTDLTAAEHLRRLGFPVTGTAISRTGRHATTAWIDRAC